MCLLNETQICKDLKPSSYANKLLRCLSIKMREETEIDKILSFIYDENHDFLNILRKRFKAIYSGELDQILELGSDTSNSILFNNRFDLKEQAIFLTIQLCLSRKDKSLFLKWPKTPIHHPFQYWYDFEKFFERFTLHFISTKLEYFLENRGKYSRQIDEILRNIFDHSLFLGFIEEIYRENPKEINFYGFDNLVQFLKENNNSVECYMYEFSTKPQMKERALYFLMMIGTQNDYWQGKNFYDFFWRYTMLYYSKRLEEAIIDINPYSLPSNKINNIACILESVFSVRKYCHFMSNFVDMKTLLLYTTNTNRSKRRCKRKKLKEFINRIKQNKDEDNSLKKLLFFLIQRGNSKEWKHKTIRDLYPNFEVLSN